MDKPLLQTADDGLASLKDAEDFAGGFSRRALCHVIAWALFFVLSLLGLSQAQSLGYATTSMILTVALALLAVYFLFTLVGLYLRCKGQAPADLEAIARDGGRYVKTPQGRIVEYFVWGCRQPDATVAVIIHGQAVTGKCSQLLYPEDILQRLNVKAIAPSCPGHGYTDAVPNRRLALWPKDDLEHVLKQEGVEQFIVEGWSYGTAHAMAAASYFGESKCVAMGLNCPYLCRDICREHGMKTDADMILSERATDSAAIAPVYALLGLIWPIVAKGMSMIEDTKIAVKEDPELFAAFEAEVRRGAVRGVAPHVQEMLNQETNQVWQDPRTLKTKNVAVWYAKDDTQCPPEHGKWLAELFEGKAPDGVKCNNRAAEYKWGHFSFVKKEERGNLIKALIDLMRS